MNDRQAKSQFDKDVYRLQRHYQKLMKHAQACMISMASLQEKRLREAEKRTLPLNQIRLLERDLEVAEGGILTLEELRRMVGEPVWVEDFLIANCSAYHFVQIVEGEPILIEARFYPLGSKAVPYYGTSAQSGYEQTWVAYRRRPREAG